MYDLIVQLKGIVTIILISEFLKELLTTKRFHKYIQFAVSLMLFCFILGLILRTDLTLPENPLSQTDQTYENLLKAEYEADISEAIKKRLADNAISADVSVYLNDNYEIEKITFYTAVPPEAVKALLEGDLPYEVVFRSESP